MEDGMKKQRILCAALAAAFVISGCGVKKNSTEKRKDITFTVLDEEKIPEELAERIEEKKEQPFKITYADKGTLYIAEGYGCRETSGYSIEVKSCYETENTVCVHTNLIGPSKEEKVVKTDTCPYIVLRMEMTDKTVVFK